MKKLEVCIARKSSRTRKMTASNEDCLHSAWNIVKEWIQLLNQMCFEKKNLKLNIFENLIGWARNPKIYTLQYIIIASLFPIAIKTFQRHEDESTIRGTALSLVFPIKHHRLPASYIKNENSSTTCTLSLLVLVYSCSATTYVLGFEFLIISYPSTYLYSVQLTWYSACIKKHRMPRGMSN